MDADTLHEVELWIIKEQMSFTNYAGKAFLDDDKLQMKFWLGQHIALERLRKRVSQKHLELLVEEDKEEEEKTYAAYVKKQMATLKDYDHGLFTEVVEGLKRAGAWIEEGGSPTYRLLHKGWRDILFAIKVFRDAEAPQVIKICFSAEPEEVEEKLEPGSECPKCGGIRNKSVFDDPNLCTLCEGSGVVPEPGGV